VPVDDDKRVGQDPGGYAKERWAFDRPGRALYDGHGPVTYACYCSVWEPRSDTSVRELPTSPKGGRAEYGGLLFREVSNERLSRSPSRRSGSATS
jgi:hypothetical protein